MTSRIARRQFGFLVLGASLGACEERSANAAAVYVLLDVSASYYKELTKSVRSTKTLMAFVHAFDSFAVAEIGACSFSDEAVVLKFTAPSRPSERQRMVAAAAGKLDEYRAKVKETQFTDIRGALTQAGQYLSGRSASARYVIIFSDMDEDLPASCRRDAKLPLELKGVQIIAVNIIRLPEDNREPARYTRRLDAWRKVVEEVGATWRVVSDPSDLFPLLRDR